MAEVAVFVVQRRLGEPVLRQHREQPLRHRRSHRVVTDQVIDAVVLAQDVARLAGQRGEPLLHAAVAVPVHEAHDVHVLAVAEHDDALVAAGERRVVDPQQPLGGGVRGGGRRGQEQGCDAAPQQGPHQRWASVVCGLAGVALSYAA